jgi:hypothetical protein
MARRLGSHVVFGDAVQLPFEQREKLPDGAPVAASPGEQKARDVVSLFRLGHALCADCTPDKRKRFLVVAVSAAVFR